jgi:hypothetical protein
MIVPDCLLSSMQKSFLLLLLILIARLAGPETKADDSAGNYVPLFEPNTLAGWRETRPFSSRIAIKDGVLSIPSGSSGELTSEREFDDFLLRFQFRAGPGGNLRLGLRRPEAPGLLNQGLEIPLLDIFSSLHADLPLDQSHGALFRVRGAGKLPLNPAGSWNEKVIEASGRQLAIALNGETVLKVDLNSVADGEILQSLPGLLRPRGRIVLNSLFGGMELKEMEIKQLPATPLQLNEPPPGFVALFNGKDLNGWGGRVDIPMRRRLSTERLREIQQTANRVMKRNWRVQDGVLRYTGTGFDNISTEEEFGDFELWLDWKIEAGGDSGVYLRGVPQVQIWDHPEGSGGLWNNRQHPSQPLLRADRPPGQWNHFRILMTADRITVHLNDQLVTQNVPLENYWFPAQPLFSEGPIELQAHRTRVFFRNIFIRPLELEPFDKTDSRAAD